MPEVAQTGQDMLGDVALGISPWLGRAVVGLPAAERTTRRVSACISA